MPRPKPTDADIKERKALAKTFKVFRRDFQDHAASLGRPDARTRRRQPCWLQENDSDDRKRED